MKRTFLLLLLGFLLKFVNPFSLCSAVNVPGSENPFKSDNYLADHSSVPMVLHQNGTT